MNYFEDIQDPELRRATLRDTAFRIRENETYTRRLTEDELIQRRERLSEDVIALNDIEERKKEAVKAFKDEAEPYQLETKLLLTEIKNKYAQVVGTTFDVANHDTSMMETYNEEGELISSRRLRPDEKQTNVFQLSKAK